MRLTVEQRRFKRAVLYRLIDTVIPREFEGGFAVAFDLTDAEVDEVLGTVRDMLHREVKKMR